MWVKLTSCPISRIMCGFRDMVWPPLKIVIGFESLYVSFGGTTITGSPTFGRHTKIWLLFAEGRTIADFYVDEKLTLKNTKNHETDRYIVGPILNAWLVLFDAADQFGALT